MSIPSTTRVEPFLDRDPALDGVRALACLAVYFYHLGIDLRSPPLVIQGSSGVLVFFVLSGYLLFGPYARTLSGERPWPPWPSYLIRRFSRIYPPYLVALLAYTAARYGMESLQPGQTRSPPPGWSSFTSHALLVFNYTDRKEFFAINGAFWTLAIEAQFYLILPLVSALARRCHVRTHRSTLIFVAILAAVGLGSRVIELLYFRHFQVPDELPRFVAVTSYLDFFAPGLALAILAQSSARRVSSAWQRWALGGLGLGLFLAAENWSIFEGKAGWQGPSSPLYQLFSPIVAATGLGLMLQVLITRSTTRAGLLTTPPVRWIGMTSYSIYLYHILIQVGMLALISRRYHLVERWQFIGVALVAMVPTLLVAAASYYLIERPSFRWGLRYSSRKVSTA